MARSSWRRVVQLTTVTPSAVSTRSTTCPRTRTCRPTASYTPTLQHSPASGTCSTPMLLYKVCVLLSCCHPLGGRITRYTLTVRPSVCLFVVTGLITRKRKIIQRSNLEKRLPTCRITGRAILRSKGQRSRSLGRKEGMPHIALAIGAALSSVQLNRHNTYIRTYIMLQCMFSMVLHRLF